MRVQWTLSFSSREVGWGGGSEESELAFSDASLLRFKFKLTSSTRRFLGYPPLSFLEVRGSSETGKRGGKVANDSI